MNDYYKPKAGDHRERGDRNFYVQSLEVQGPFEARSDLPTTHRKIVFKTPQIDGSDRRQVARQVIERRRPEPSVGRWRTTRSNG